MDVDVEWILIILILFIGSFIQGVSGFGFGLFSMGLLPFLLTVKESTLLVLFLTIFISFRIVLTYRSYIQWKKIIMVVITAILGRIFSFYILHYYGDMNMMKMWLGFVLIGFVIYFVTKKGRGQSHSFFQTTWFGGAVGFVGGLIGGVFAVGGPFFVMYLMAANQEKQSYNANLQTIFLFTNLFTIVLHSLNRDFLILSNWLSLLIAICAVFLGVKLGLKWFERLPVKWIEKIASIIVLFAALNLIFFSA